MFLLYFHRLYQLNEIARCSSPITFLDITISFKYFTRVVNFSYLLLINIFYALIFRFLIFKASVLLLIFTRFCKSNSECTYAMFRKHLYRKHFITKLLSFKIILKRKILISFFKQIEEVVCFETNNYSFSLQNLKTIFLNSF